MIRLALLDDHQMLREGLRRKFEDYRDIACEIEAGSAREFFAALAGRAADVVILDIKLPDANGLQLIHRLRQSHPRCKVVVLTMYDHVRYLMGAREAGADGFLVKGAPFEELLAAVRRVHGGKTYVCHEMAAKLKQEGGTAARPDALSSLSHREFEVLSLLSAGLSLKAVADRMDISGKTIDTYRARLMKKLNLSSKADLIQFAIEHGVRQ